MVTMIIDWKPVLQKKNFLLLAKSKRERKIGSALKKFPACKLSFLDSYRQPWIDGLPFPFLAINKTQRKLLCQFQTHLNFSFYEPSNITFTELKYISHFIFCFLREMDFTCDNTELMTLKHGILDWPLFRSINTDYSNHILKDNTDFWGKDFDFCINHRAAHTKVSIWRNPLRKSMTPRRESLIISP